MLSFSFLLIFMMKKSLVPGVSYIWNEDNLIVVSIKQKKMRG